jgi:hypothetical protein
MSRERLSTAPDGHSASPGPRSSKKGSPCWEPHNYFKLAGTSEIGTLVERITCYVMLVHLPIDRSTEGTREALIETMATLPPISGAP